MMTSLVGSGGASTGFSSLQGAVGAMRLAYRCSSATGGGDGNTASPDPSTESSDNPLGIVLPSLPLELSAAGGSIIGNSVLVAVVAVAAHALVKVRGMLWSVPSCLRAPLRTLTSLFFALVPTSLLPGSVVIGYAVVMQPTMRAAVVSVASTARTAGSVALGVAGLAGCVVPGLLLWWRIRRLNLSVEAVLPGRLVLASPARLLRWVAAPRWRWRSVSSATLPQYGIVIEAHNRRWYFLVELCLAGAGGVVLGVSWIADDACSAAVWGTSLMMALAIVEIVLCVWLRPHCARCDGIVNILMCILSVVIDALVLQGLEAEASGVAIASSSMEYVPILMVIVLVTRPVLRGVSVLRHRIDNREARCIAKRQREALLVLVQLAAQSTHSRNPVDLL